MKNRKLKPGVEKALVILTVVLFMFASPETMTGFNLVSFLIYEAVIFSLIAVNCIVLRKYGRTFAKEAK